MAASSGGLLEKDQVGKREQLFNLLAIVDDKATPVFSMISKPDKLENTTFSWLMDKYGEPSTDTTVDGTDVTAFADTSENRKRVFNTIHYFRRTGKVSTLAENVSKVAGVPSEIGLARAKQLKLLKRDMEAVLLSDQDPQLDDGAVGYRTRGLGHWILTADATTLFPIPSLYCVPSAQVNTTATASLLEDADIQAMLQAVYDNTGMIGDFKFIVGSILRRRFTDMTRTIANQNNTSTKVRTFTQDANTERVISSTKVFEGDFGIVEILPDNFIGFDNTTKTPDKDRGYLLDFDKVHWVSNRLPQIKALPDGGGGERFMIESWGGTRVDNPLGCAKFLP